MRMDYRILLVEQGVYKMDKCEWKELHLESREYEWTIDLHKYNEMTDDKDLYLKYRKLEPKAPSHEEIMTKWWKTGIHWKRVLDYNTENSGWYVLQNERSPVSKAWFIDMESADIPPEAE